MTKSLVISKRIIDSLASRQEGEQWELLIAQLLRRLELKPDEKAMAEAAYDLLGASIAKKLNLPRHDVDVFAQGSMRTQTTINPRHPTNFDIDVFVKLTGPGYDAMDAETMFHSFGKALEGNESVTGVPYKKRRCWRLDYPNKPFYFDVTPAVRGTSYAGLGLRVRDPETIWAPTNPADFANWFCKRAELRFIFGARVIKSIAMDERASVEPLPQEEVGLDDILRRTVQLMKLHRDNMYHYADVKRKEAQPISVIIVTLATHAYADLWNNGKASFRSPLEVVLALVERMPFFIDYTSGKYLVANPELHGENFADRWNSDSGLRAAEFKRWHARLETDLEKLLHQGTKTANEADIREVFGAVGVEAWKASQPKSNILDGLLLSSTGLTKFNPTTPIKPGTADSLG
ncbi:nucleotidyltransferase [Janthinobacterium sp.]|uniref:nucleotidyltransferase domain-containing protein n=1 Tax=Janthinobacterium sp. TaxID=1871054 RepID=UPI002607A430|nr:nucleotidyltransferase [Janthinobacterium sp.]